MAIKIPFNKPYVSGLEYEYTRQAYENGHLACDGPFSKKCESWLESRAGCHKAILTSSCTVALELAAILADIKPGDEIIMPSFTFVSTANAFVLRGGVPVFVDIRPDTLNLDEKKIEAAITPKTKAIVPMHYGGVPCEMDTMMAIAKKHELLVIEDAAQGILSHDHGRPLGSIGHLGVFSFHETKNIICGEGGALLINNPRFVERAEMVSRKGTDRSRFLSGQVDKYTWRDIGSSYRLSELAAAFLFGQMENADRIISERLEIWKRYYDFFCKSKLSGQFNLPLSFSKTSLNGHLFYLLLDNQQSRPSFLKYLNKRGVGAIFHYAPLHDSEAGMKFGRVHGTLDVTDGVSKKLVRLPLWIGLDSQAAKYICEMVQSFFNA